MWKFLTNFTVWSSEAINTFAYCCSIVVGIAGTAIQARINTWLTRMNWKWNDWLQWMIIHYSKKVDYISSSLICFTQISLQTSIHNFSDLYRTFLVKALQTTCTHRTYQKNLTFMNIINDTPKLCRFKAWYLSNTANHVQFNSSQNFMTLSIHVRKFSSSCTSLFHLKSLDTFKKVIC